MAGQYKNQVRIIGGQWKRRQLKFPTQEGLRPTPDRIKETLFNWLGQDCTGMICLDLFAGSGGLGFEAASRNAQKVVLVDTGRAVLEALRANQAMLDAKNIEVVWSDGLRFVDATTEKFDLVFLDPPFASELLTQALERLPRILNEDALVYVETAHWPELAGWEVIKEAKAGQVIYGLLRRTSTSG